MVQAKESENRDFVGNLGEEELWKGNDEKRYVWDVGGRSGEWKENRDGERIVREKRVDEI